jgi:hypothetical protein
MSITSLVSGRRRVGLAAVVAAGLAVTGASTGFAASGASGKSAQQGGSAAAPAHATGASGGASATAVAPVICKGGRHKLSRVASSNTHQVLSDKTPVNLFSAPLVVPGPPRFGRDRADTLLLTFSAETQLRGNTDGALFDWIQGALLVDGVPVTDVSPVSPLALSGSSTYSANAIQACVRIGRGNHRIQVQGHVVTNGSSPSETFWIDDMVLRADVLN